MKRVRCPKCDYDLTFDETRYAEGQTLVFQCPQCQRQFGVRINVPSQEQKPQEEEDCGALIVIENVFHYKQTLPLHLGDNVIGRYVQGTSINLPIETTDPSVDTTHCIINVRCNRQGEFIYTLRDASTDGTGTCVGTTLLRANDRLRIDDGTIINIGATTLILRAAGCEDEETTAESRK